MPPFASSSCPRRVSPRRRRPLGAVAAPPSAESVVIPNFWDPRSRIERPSTEEIGAIRFLTTDDFPPFAFRDRRGILIGFDVDLAEAVCDVLKVQCAIQTRPFDTLVAGLKDGTGNAIIAGFDVEKAPAEGLIASQAYLKIPGRFVARKDATFDPGPPIAQGFRRRGLRLRARLLSGAFLPRHARRLLQSDGDAAR